MIRLNKFLADAGVASRRGSDTLIRSGRVTVNGLIPENIGMKVDPEVDLVVLDDNVVTSTGPLIYCILNKPAGCVTTVTDTHGRPTVMDYLKDIPQRVFPVGRLDFDTEGLLLITNDGDLSQTLSHPRFKVEKEYLVTVRGRPTSPQLDRLETGVAIDGRLTAPAKVALVSKKRGRTCLRMTIREGRKRQIRYMFRSLGYQVERLIRIRIGPIILDDLKPGTWRMLTKTEISSLKIPPKMKDE